MKNKEKYKQRYNVNDNLEQVQKSKVHMICLRSILKETRMPVTLNIKGPNYNI